MTRPSPKVLYDWSARQPWLDLAFPIDEYRARLERVREAMSTRGLDALFVHGGAGDNASVRYLANFDLHAGDTLVVVPLQREPILATTWVMHDEPMHTMFWTTWIQDARPLLTNLWGAEGGGSAWTKAVTDIAAALNLSHARIGLAGGARPATIEREWKAALPDAEWHEANDLLLAVRAIKSPREIELMRAVARMGGAGLRVALEAIQPGVSELEVAATAYQAMTAAGAEEFAFPTAVVSGPRAGLKHAPPSARRMQAGDMIFLDLGAKHNGYVCDLSRCSVAGKASDEQKRFLDTSLEIFTRVMEVIKPGNSVKVIHRVAEEIAVRAGCEDAFMPTGFGHGLGTSLIELPSLRPPGETVLQPGMVFALEPMLVRYNFGTAVVEETVLVTENGAETLSGVDWQTW